MRSKKLNIAIVGATGLVGKMLLEILTQRCFPVENLFLLASEQSSGKTVVFNQQNYHVDSLAGFDWQSHQVDIAFFSAGNEVSLHYAPIARASGCVVIDNSSAFRYDDEIFLIVPEVNGNLLKPLLSQQRGSGMIIANPNCSTIQLAMVLAPIQAAVGLKRVIVSTYQAVSGAGQGLVDELILSTKSGASPLSSIVANAIPQIDVLQENGYSREEMKMLWESRKILGLPNLLLSATAVRVPVVNTHSESVVIETNQPFSVKQAVDCLKTQPGVVVLEDRWITPREVSGRDEVYVSRIRQDLAFGDKGLSFWVVADNLRKGAALNAVQIAEILRKSWFA